MAVNDQPTTGLDSSETNDDLAIQQLDVHRYERDHPQVVYAHWIIRVDWIVTFCSILAGAMTLYKLPLLLHAYKMKIPYGIFPWQRAADQVPSQTPPLALLWHLFLALTLMTLDTIIIAVHPKSLSPRAWANLYGIRNLLTLAFVCVIGPFAVNLGGMPPVTAFLINMFLCFIMTVAAVISLENKAMAKEASFLARHGVLIHYGALMMAPLAELVSRFAYELQF